MRPAAAPAAAAASHQFASHHEIDRATPDRMPAVTNRNFRGERDLSGESEEASRFSSAAAPATP